MKARLLLSALLVTLISCRTVPKQTVQVEALPGNLSLEARQFALKQGAEIECWSAQLGAEKRPVYVIFKNGVPARVVPQLPAYRADVRIREKTLSRVSRTLKLPSLNTAAFKGVLRHDNHNREPLNILPAFVILSPLLVSDAVEEWRINAFKPGDSLDRLPHRRSWRVRDGLMFNERLALAVRVSGSGGVVAGVFERDFYRCEFP
ncbi:MAG: hypothetical protein JWM59_3700 [Verrucomicrobiales bacterium]|nr:hypothetical protein [Verrucomicrobiales bacterium]